MKRILLLTCALMASSCGEDDPLGSASEAYCEATSICSPDGYHWESRASCVADRRMFIEERFAELTDHEGCADAQLAYFRCVDRALPTDCNFESAMEACLDLRPAVDERCPD